MQPDRGRCVVALQQIRGRARIFAEQFLLWEAGPAKIATSGIAGSPSDGLRPSAARLRFAGSLRMGGNPFSLSLRELCGRVGTAAATDPPLANGSGGIPEKSRGSEREHVEETMRRTVAFLVICGLATTLAGSALAQEIDWKKVDAALARTGAAMPGGVQRYGLPRSDLNVTVDGVAIKPALALGGWVAFQPAHDGAMVMGEVVLTAT